MPQSSPPPTATTSPNAPYRLALCITDLDAGGAEKALVRIATGLSLLPAGASWEPVVYCLGREGELAQPLRDAGIRVECYGATGALDYWGARNWLMRHLRQQQPAALMSFLFHANVISRWAGRRARVPVIVSGHRVAEKQKRWHLWLDRWTAKAAHHHVCVSQGVLEHVRNHMGVSPSRLSVIPNGIDIPDPLPDPVNLEAEFGIPQGTRAILAVGRLHPQKGFLALLEAFQQLRKDLEDVHLLILGEGEQRRELEAAVQRLKLKSAIHLPGRREDVLGIMSSSHVLALPSQWEGMPNVVLEAMAVGLPVVAFDVEGISELIEDGRTGLVVSPQQATLLAQTLVRVLEDQGLARDLSAAAQAYCRKRFAWSEVVSEYNSLLRNLIA